MPKRGENLVVDGQKRCLVCKTWQPVSNFYGRPRRNRPGEMYYDPRCNGCRKKYQANYYRQRCKEDPTYGKSLSRVATLKKYGLTPEDYDRMVEDQDGKCAICGNAPGMTAGVDRHNLVVDHDHACCGENRACDRCRRKLLCDFCNRGLGIFREDPALMFAAMRYLLMHKKDDV